MLNKYKKYILLAPFVFACSNAYAVEGGSIAYPSDVDTVFNAINPPPGQARFYIYTQYSNSTSFAGKNGKNMIPGFDASSEVASPRLLYTWPHKIGPFTVTSGVNFTFLNLNITSNGNSSHNFGLADTTISPVYLGWSNAHKTLYISINSDIYMPTGSYSASRMDNLGLNYYTFQPSLHLTWFATRRIEVDATGEIGFNTTNGATHYHSGSVVNGDYAVNYNPEFSILPNLLLGVQGYVLKQVQDDTQNGVVVENGFRAQTYAIGGQIGYRFNNGSAILLKYTDKFYVRNQPKGDLLWFEYTTPMSF